MMTRLTKIIFAAAFSLLSLCTINTYAQTKAKKEVSKKREAQRAAMHLRDSLMRAITRSDTSINSLLQRMEQYTANFNQISNSLSEGVDTVDIGEQLPAVIKRADKINSAAHTHKAGTLRFLFVLRDNLDHMQDQLEGWQSDILDVNTKLVQNQNDLIKFTKDTLIKKAPSDSNLRKTYFAELRQVRALWRQTDSLNRGILLKVNLLQDKMAICYTKVLDESDEVDSKIKGFASKAIAGESDYIWHVTPQYRDLSEAVSHTARLDSLLLSNFFKTDLGVHLVALLFLAIIFIWILYHRGKVLKKAGSLDAASQQAAYILKHPVMAPLLVVTAIIPYFYNHPPTALMEILFLISIALTMVLIKNEIGKPAYQFLKRLFILGFIYAVSNLLIDISSIDRYIILLLSVVSFAFAFSFHLEVKKSPNDHLPYAALALKVFMSLQVISFILNVTGRFALAKIFGVTAVFNLWFLIVLFMVLNILMQAIFIHFEARKGGNSIVNWMDYSLVQKKFKQTLLILTSLLWVFSLFQNLDIDDWVKDNIHDVLNQSQSVGGASFTIGGFVIFVLVIWLSSIVSRIISYFYDISAQRVTDLSVLKRKNRTSALIIRIGVFSAGFLLAVAASGFPMDKLTIIISAFGVGIGFGLQNIVNNLVSGLILAFEKPINIGDVIEVDGHTGTMKEIGIRSSKVVTGDGSEVIIPNGDFISHQVVNWTLSNSNRQIELKVITAYGIDINKVKELLKGLLADRDDVMSKPGPAVFINNITESIVEFKLLFWEADISTTGELRSKILTEIYAMLGKEGVQLPGGGQTNLYLHFPEGVPITDARPAKSGKKDEKEAK